MNQIPRYSNGTAVLGTEECKEWLKSMPEAQRAPATQALSELTLVSAHEYETEVKALIENIISSAHRAVALFCVRDVRKREDGKPDPYFGSQELEAVRADEPGSDWRMAHLLYRLRNNRVLFHPKVDEMRKAKVSDVVIADDVSISGTNLGNFLRAFHQDPTLYSWQSHNWIRYHVVVHTLGASAVAGAKRKLRRYGSRQIIEHFPELHFAREDDGTYSPQTLTFLAETRTLLGGEGKSMARGFKSSLGKTVFAHACPNNVPAIFWDDGGTVTPLFPARSVPSCLMTSFQAPPVPQATLSPGATLGPLDQHVLGHVGSGAHTVRAVAGRANLSIARSEAALTRLRSFGLVDADGRLTLDGKRAMASSLIPEHEKKPLSLPSEFYYRR